MGQMMNHLQTITCSRLVLNPTEIKRILFNYFSGFGTSQIDLVEQMRELHVRTSILHKKGFDCVIQQTDRAIIVINVVHVMELKIS